jgi:hypothetical protein
VLSLWRTAAEHSSARVMLVPTRRAVTGEYALSRRETGIARPNPSSPSLRSTAPAASALNVEAKGKRSSARKAISRPDPVSTA